MQGMSVWIDRHWQPLDPLEREGHMQRGPPRAVHYLDELCCGCCDCMWRLINCFRGTESEPSRASVSSAHVEGRAAQYQAPAVAAPLHLGSVSSADEDQDLERGTLLPKRRTPEPAGPGRVGQTSSSADPGQPLDAQPHHRRTGSGASSRGLGGEGPSRHRRGRSSSSNALLNFGKKGLQEDESLGGKTGLLTADAPSEDDYDCCPTCLEAYTDENPKVWTRCGHHFHLQCIYEWLNRANTCPMCERPMDFEEDLIM